MTRRKYTPEEKIRIVLEGCRREVTLSDLCRREGIKPGAYYAWTKDFMEGGKERPTRDTVREANRRETVPLFNTLRNRYNRVTLYPPEETIVSYRR